MISVSRRKNCCGATNLIKKIERNLNLKSLYLEIVKNQLHCFSPAEIKSLNELVAISASSTFEVIIQIAVHQRLFQDLSLFETGLVEPLSTVEAL